MARQATAWLILAAALLLGGCGSFEVQDSAPSNPQSVHGISDAVPKAEPRSKYGNPDSYVVAGTRYHVLSSARGYSARGEASWYGTKFHGKRTSSGELYNMYSMSAAHKTLPIPSYVEVTNLDNGRKAVVRVNDRGPFVRGRIIDLSYAAAKKLGVYDTGTARVEIRAIDPDAPVSHVASSTSANPNAKTGNVYLQVGAFTERKNAEDLLSRLLAQVRENILINRNPATANAVYRVRIGPLNSEQHARSLASQLAKLGIDAAHVVVE